MEFTGTNLEERRRIREAERERLGSFTEGVAHVVRNPLTGIGAGVELLGRMVAQDAPTQGNVAAILREVDRVNNLLEEMLRITHPPRLSRARADLERLLRRVADEAQGTSEVEVQCGTLGGEPLIDAEQLRQALAELLANALEASDGSGPVRLEAHRGPTALPVARGPELCIVVENRGARFPEQVLSHAFEPFRTTKPGRKGLGLYIANDIVGRHGGELGLESLPGGARVTLHLPWETDHDHRN